MTTNLITNFDDFDGPNENRFLSNFYRGEPIHVFEDSWLTGEHAFQAMKSKDHKMKAKIKAAGSPGQAKKLGRRCTLVEDWEEIKYDVMAAIIRAKFTRDRAEGAMLLGTGHALLVEGTRWHDTVWGVDANGKHGRAKGRNWLGTLLMARRAELLAQSLGAPDYCTGSHNEAWLDGSL